MSEHRHGLRSVAEAPADTREEAYWLLSKRSPRRVLVDPELPEGQWYVVRGPTQAERERASLTPVSGSAA